MYAHWGRLEAVDVGGLADELGRIVPYSLQPSASVFGDVAQLGEHQICILGVGGSSPLVSTGRREKIFMAAIDGPRKGAYTS